MQKMWHMNDGRSMIEMIGVLSVTAVLSIGGLIGYTKMMGQYKINKSIEQITSMAARISAFGSGTVSYAGLSNNNAAKFNALPSEVIVGDGSTLKNPFGGQIHIAPSPLFSGGDDVLAYTITYTDLPEEACVALGSHDWGRGKHTAFIGMIISSSGDGATDAVANLYQKCPGKNDSGYIAACAGGTVVKSPLSVLTAAEKCSCNDGTTDDNCAIVLKYF